MCGNGSERGTDSAEKYKLSLGWSCSCGARASVPSARLYAPIRAVKSLVYRGGGGGKKGPPGRGGAGKGHKT